MSNSKAAVTDMKSGLIARAIERLKPWTAYGRSTGFGKTSLPMRCWRLKLGDILDVVPYDILWVGRGSRFSLTRLDTQAHVTGPAMVLRVHDVPRVMGYESDGTVLFAQRRVSIVSGHYSGEAQLGEREFFDRRGLWHDASLRVPQTCPPKKSRRRR